MDNLAIIGMLSGKRSRGKPIGKIKRVGVKAASRSKCDRDAKGKKGKREL